MVHFYFLLDTIRCNSLSLFAIKHGKNLRNVESFDTCWDLTMSFVKLFISERSLTGLSIGLKSKITILLGRNTADRPVAEIDEGYSRYNDTRQWCKICLGGITGKDKLNKMKSRCQMCRETVCDAHSKLICQKHL